MSKVKTIKNLFQFIFKTKKFWLLPLVLILVLIGFILVVTQGSALAPFIYTLF